MVQAPFCFNSIVGSVFAEGVISGVSVITEGEAKGHGVYIDSKTLLSVKECAETHTSGVQVKSNHGTGFESIVGVLRNFRIEGAKLLADLHLLKSHEDFNRIVEIAQTMPASVGLSISFSGDKEEIKGKTYARCTELYSVDFVDRPAANPSGLFSVVDSPPKGMDKAESFFAGLKQWVGITESAELSAAQKNLTELSSQVSTLKADLAIANEKATKAETTLAAELAALPAKIKGEGSMVAQQILATFGQKMPITQLPNANPASGSQESAFKTYSELMAQGKAAEASRFYAANADAIVKSRNK